MTAPFNLKQYMESRGLAWGGRTSVWPPIKQEAKKMQGSYQPIINPVKTASSILEQLLTMGIQADNQTARIVNETMELLRALKSGEVTLDQLEVGENGWSIIPMSPIEQNGKKDVKELATV